MEPQERDLITTLLTRLQSAAGQPKDAEADALIRQAMTQMPDAPYYLVQTVLIQDLSLHNAQNRIAELEKQVATSAAAAAQPTSFLGGLLARSQPAAAERRRAGRGPARRKRRPRRLRNTRSQAMLSSLAMRRLPAACLAARWRRQQVPALGRDHRSRCRRRRLVVRRHLLAVRPRLRQRSRRLWRMGGGGMPGGLGETVINNYYGDDRAPAPAAIMAAAVIRLCRRRRGLCRRWRRRLWRRRR